MVDGNYAGATAVLDTVMLLNTDRDPEFAYLRGQVQLSTDGTKAAIPWFKRAVAMEPENHTFNCDLATVLISGDRPADALPYAKSAWASNKTEEQANVNLLHSLRETGSNSELEKVARHALDLDSQSPQFWNQVARAFRGLGRRRLALRICQRALAVDADFVPGWCLTAELQMDLAFTNKALQSLIRLKELDPERHGKRCLINLVHVQGDLKGDWPSALEFAVQARTQFGGDDDVDTAYQRVVRAISGSQDAAQDLIGRFEALHQERDELRTAFEGFQPEEKGIPLGVARDRLENEEIEFIESFPKQARDLAKEIAAFSTSHDGCIFLGVGDDGTVVGLRDLNSREEKDALVDRIAGITSQTISPPVHVQTYFCQIGDSVVAKIFVPKGSEPVYYVNFTPYVRHLDQSRPATHEEVKELILRASQAAARS